MSELMTQIGHTIIIVGVGAAYFRANQAKDLVEIQREMIDTLQKAFDDCKTRLAEIEKKIK